MAAARMEGGISQVDPAIADVPGKHLFFLFLLILSYLAIFETRRHEIIEFGFIIVDGSNNKAVIT